MSGALLCLETATDLLSVAVVSGEGKLLSAVSRHAPRLHSALLVPTTAQALELAGVAKSGLQGVCVNRGPGSYTGVRIGLAAAQALGQGLAIPVFGVPGLWAAAAARAQLGLYAPALDARRQDAFCALYEVHREGLPKELLEPALRSLEAFCSELAGFARPVECLGDAWQREGSLFDRFPTLRRGPGELQAADLGRFVIRAREEASIVDALSTTALYLRPPAVANGGFHG